MSIKTYTNKSNAARAAKKVNGGNLDGLVLLGSEGAWFYAPPADTEALAAQAAESMQAAPATAPTAEALLEASNGITAAATPSKAPSKAPSKRAPTKAATTLPSGKDVAGAYPGGVAKTKASASKGKPRTKTGYRLEKERPEAHGVQRKSTGTVGDQLWALYDGVLAGLRKKDKGAAPKDVPLATVRSVGVAKGFNPTTVALAFYQWRRFHGVRGRGKKQKVD